MFQVCSYEPVSISNKIRPGKMGKIIRAEIPSTVECRMPLRCLRNNNVLTTYTVTS